MKKQIQQANSERKAANPDNTFIAIDTIGHKALQALPKTMRAGETKLAIVGEGKEHRTLVHAYKSPEGAFSSYSVDSSSVITVPSSGNINFNMKPYTSTREGRFNVQSREKVSTTRVMLAIQRGAGPCGNLSLEGAKYIQSHPQTWHRIHRRQLGTPLEEDRCPQTMTTF